MPDTPDQMLDLANQLAQASSGEEVLSMLEEAGYELAATEAMGEEPLTLDAEDEALGEEVEEGAEEEGLEAAEEGGEMVEEMMEGLPMPGPAPTEGGPRLNIVAARFRAADNALKKNQGKKANERS